MPRITSGAPVRSASAEEAASILEAASSVIIVPGYGLAVAQVALEGQARVCAVSDDDDVGARDFAGLDDAHDAAVLAVQALDVDAGDDGGAGLAGLVDEPLVGLRTSD